MGSFQRLSPGLRILSVLILTIVLNACGPRGIGAGSMNSFGANGSIDRNRENQLLNRLFRDSPAGQPPPPPTPAPSETQPEKGSQEQEDETPELPDPQPEPQADPEQPDEDRDQKQRPQSQDNPKEPQAPKEQKTPRPTQANARGYWDDKVADGRKWTAYAVHALNELGGNLLKEVPSDISNYCPRYSKLDRDGRIDFWVKMISAIAAVESGYRPSTSFKEKMNDRNGNRVISRGLLQISLESARSYGCATNNDGDLLSPRRNIECGVRILNRWVPADGVISRQGDDRWYGAARYWSTLRSSKKSSQTIRKLLKTNPRCH